MPSALLVIAALVASPGDPPVKLRLADLVGEWSGAGTFVGKPVTGTFRWEPVLGNAFTRLEVRIQPNQAAAPVFEGKAYYRTIADSVAGGTWLDSHGNTYPLGVRLEGDSLTVAWGSETPARGQSVYRLREDGTLEVIDRVRGKTGDLSEINRFEVRRN